MKFTVSLILSAVMAGHALASPIMAAREADAAEFDVDAGTFSGGAKWVKERDAEANFNVERVTGARSWIKAREADSFDVDAGTFSGAAKWVKEREAEADAEAGFNVDRVAGPAIAGSAWNKKRGAFEAGNA